MRLAALITVSNVDISECAGCVPKKLEDFRSVVVVGVR